MQGKMNRKTDGQPWMHYQGLLDAETRSVPFALRQIATHIGGPDHIAVERYLSREFYDLEKEKLWPRVWQAVCRESEVASAGDYFVHRVADADVLLVRTESGDLVAFHNACLHRGRRLKTGGSTGRGRADQLQCPYHGFT